MRRLKLARGQSPATRSGSSSGKSSEELTREAVKYKKIYTDWANRYLAKCALDPIRDLTTELRDVRILVNLVHSVNVFVLALHRIRSVSVAIGSCANWFRQTYFIDFCCF
ncbi:hypothetical protein L596_000095 [Steinernema carpocapsae]|uniref:Calponin-homology (CH) domain-containing protein n=1 Tax=Steinernema carpocapsae TaxID=34508 RepID=A0A4U8UHM8_STECR|nr:hypothetical protein L596_000095 [Steinernema carpocapsae]